MDKAEARRGSRRWMVLLAEKMTWVSVAVALAVVLAADLPPSARVGSLIPAVLLGAWTGLFFHVAVPHAERRRGIAWVSGGIGLLLSAWLYAGLSDRIPSAHLLLVPAIVIAGLLGRVPEALAAAAAASGIHVAIAWADDPAPEIGESVINVGLFLLAGWVSGLLARELRSHYRGELEEHRLATAVRSRLMAVLDAVDEAIVFSDRLGVVRMVNARAADLFDVDPDEYLGVPRVQLLRTVARRTEDPEGFMELFQRLHDQPALELRTSIEQILPARRQLRLYSGPVSDETGARVGRIDVYTDVSESVQRAADNERLYEQARKTAESYLRGLMPDGPPKLPRTSLVAHYIPVAGDRAVCGDFYDFLTLANGRLGIVLGDVCGSGPKAANDAALTRYTLASYASEITSPVSLLEKVGARLHAQLPGDRFVRLLFAVLDPERAVLEYTNAGHVPPIVRRARTGEVLRLQEGGLPLGVDGDAPYRLGRVELDPGDLVVFHTDGVTGARRGDHVFGPDRLVDLVRDWGGGSPAELVQAIVRGVESWVAPGGLADDIALVACQVVPDAAVAEPARELVLPNEPARIAQIRAFVGAFLADLRAPVEVSSEILLAASEAAANACRHGRRADGRSEVRLRCALHGRDVVVTIADDGPGFDYAEAQEHAAPDPFASGGRGLFLIREFSDSAHFDVSEGGTTVTLTRRVFDRPPPM